LARPPTPLFPYSPLFRPAASTATEVPVAPAGGPAVPVVSATLSAAVAVVAALTARGIVRCTHRCRLDLRCRREGTAPGRAARRGHADRAVPGNRKWSDTAARRTRN